MHSVAVIGTRMTAWLLLYPGEGSAGWTAHWLDFDLVAQGRDAAHALQTALEAARFLLRRRAATGEPRQFRPAPASEWARLERVLESGGVVGDLSTLPPGVGHGGLLVEAVAANYSIDLASLAPPAPTHAASSTGRSAGGAGPSEARATNDDAQASAPFRSVVTFVLQAAAEATLGSASA